jgi:hypothetical protein
MNQVIAYQLLASELAAYKEMAYEELARLVGQKFSSRKRAEDSLEYEMDIAVWWSKQGPGKILVVGMIGPVDWGSPLSRLDEHLIVSPPEPMPRR